MDDAEVVISKFPTYQEFLKELKEEERSHHEFFMDWADTKIDNWIWEICTDYTSESLSNDEQEYADGLSKEEIYLKVGKNYLKSLMQDVKDKMSDEEVFNRMDPKDKEEYDKLKKHLDELDVANEV